MVSAASAPLISEHVADAAALAHVHLRGGQVDTRVLPPPLRPFLTAYWAGVERSTGPDLLCGLRQDLARAQRRVTTTRIRVREESRMLLPTR